MAESKFNRPTFEGVSVQLESLETPKIKQGGSSNSDTLNRHHVAIAQDLTLLSTRTNALADRTDRVVSVAGTQGGALSATFQDLAMRVDSLQASGAVLCDMHSGQFLVPGDCVADLSYLFGQATLPVRAQEDLIVQRDTYGNPLVSPEVRLSFQQTATVALGSLDHSQFETDPEALPMLRDDEQLWIKDSAPAADLAWVKLEAPLQYRGLAPNVLELWPTPCFGIALQGVWVKRLGDSATYYEVDVTYMPNYRTDGADGPRLEPLGPVRLHLDNYPIVEILLCFGLRESAVWGLQHLKVYHAEYDPSGKVVFRDPFSRSVASVSLRGKDPSTLAALPVNVSGNTAEVALSSADTAKTPVLTGALVRV